MPPKTTQAEKQNETPADTPAVEIPAVEAETTHRIAGQSQIGFWRAGRHWPPEGVDVNKADFTEEQWAALEGELKLSIKTL